MRPALVVLVLALLGGACTESDLTLGADGEPFRRDESGLTPDETAEVALDDVEQYWNELLPELYGVPFQPLQGGFVPYGPNSPLPRCGPVELEYDDIAENALYCPDEDLIAWDRVGLIPQLQEDFGPLTVAVVMAHEYAHAVQARAGVEGPTVTLELQADCFAGSWAADAGAAGRLTFFDDGTDDLDDAIAGFLDLRDTVGVTALNPQAHGTGFDRVSAFQDGYELGPGACVTYEEDPPQTVAIPFTASDVETGGNLPVNQLIEPLLLDLEAFYTAFFADLDEVWDPVDDLIALRVEEDTVLECGDEDIPAEELVEAAVYCVADDSSYVEDRVLLGTLTEIGDFAFGGEVARLYAEAAQHRLGLFDVADDDAGNLLHADCLSGVYTAAQFAGEIPDQELRLSAGDLDEVLIAFLTLEYPDEDSSAFERTTAYRSGFVDGYVACEPYE